MFQQKMRGDLGHITGIKSIFAPLAVALAVIIGSFFNLTASATLADAGVKRNSVSHRMKATVSRSVNYSKSYRHKRSRSHRHLAHHARRTSGHRKFSHVPRPSGRNSAIGRHSNYRNFNHNAASSGVRLGSNGFSNRIVSSRTGFHYAGSHQTGRRHVRYNRQRHHSNRRSHNYTTGSRHVRRGHHRLSRHHRRNHHRRSVTIYRGSVASTTVNGVNIQQDCPQSHECGVRIYEDNTGPRIIIVSPGEEERAPNVITYPEAVN